MLRPVFGDSAVGDSRAAIITGDCATFLRVGATVVATNYAVANLRTTSICTEDPTATILGGVSGYDATSYLGCAFAGDSAARSPSDGGIISNNAVANCAKKPHYATISISAYNAVGDFSAKVVYTRTGVTCYSAVRD